MPLHVGPKLGAAFLVGTTMLTHPAYAQDTRAAAAPSAKAGPADNSDVQEIIVTAQKRSERLSKVPIAITAVTGDTLATARVISSGDLGQVVPGLVTNGGANTGNFWLPYIRGVGSNATGLGNNSSVATYLDGVYQPASTPNITDFSDIERIEVLKGPQGTLFGRNATGGAINIITREPSQNFRADGEVDYGRFNEFLGKAYVTGPIAPSLSFGLAYQYHGGGKYIEDLSTGGKFGGFNNHNLNAKLRFNPNERFEAIASFFFTDRKQSDSGQSLAYAPESTPVPALFGVPVNYEPRKFLANHIPIFNVRSYQGQLHMKYSLDHFDLVSITGYQNATDHTFLDFDTSPGPFFYFNEIDKIKAFSQEFQLVSNDTGPLKYLFGLYYASDKESYAPLTFGIGIPYPATPQAVAASPGGQRIDTNDTASSFVYAAFGQATYAVGSQTNLTVGARYTTERRELFGNQALLIPNASATDFNPFVIISANAKKNFSKLTWRLSVDHSFNDNVMVYASYNRGFKSGVFNSTNLAQTPVNPEVLDAFEVGGKMRLADGHVQLNLAGFYYDYKNLQVQITQGGEIILQNAASAKLYGLDADTTIRPMRNLTLRAGINLLHSEYVDYKNATVFSLIGGAGVNTVIPDASGQQLVYAPKVTVNLGGDYLVPLQGGSSLLFTANYSYTSKFKTILGEGNYFNPLSTLNASITWNAPEDRYYVGVYGRNLTNKEDIGRYLNAFGLERQLQRPRTFGAFLGFHFH